jgi:hypothetical protein
LKSERQLVDPHPTDPVQASSSPPVRESCAATQQELRSAILLLQQLIPPDELHLFDLHVSQATVYTTLVTLWLLTLQRLSGGQSLGGAVQEVKAWHGDLLPANKRVREATLSGNTGAYSRARKRLPLETVRRFAERVEQSLIALSPPWRTGQRAYILDGTTITLPPTSSLRSVYPPATNQFGETIWPVMMLLVAHELQSGCALLPEIGAMYGPHNTSEARQAAAIASRLPSGSLVLADSGFGIFSVGYALCSAGHSVLFRLTKQRFQCLRKQAAPHEPNLPGARLRLRWQPSAKERLAHPELPAGAALEVFLHEIILPSGEALYLLTSLDVPTDEASEIYRRRYDVEHDIRDFKVSLGIETMRAKSDTMIQKELLCSVVAYNLIQHLRQEAAKLSRVPPRRLSFTRVWTALQIYLLKQPPCSLEQWQVRYERTLQAASQAKLPHRPNRSYPRRAHPKRPKTTHAHRIPKPPPDETK